MHCIVFLFLLTVIATHHNPQGYRMRVIADGFTWAENLACDPFTCSMFASDALTGELWKITYDSYADVYNQSLHLSINVTATGGLVVHPKTGELFAVIRDETSNCFIVEVDKFNPNLYKIIAPMKSHMNGLALDVDSGYLYTTTESFFVPYLGEVWRIEIDTGKSSRIISGGMSDDGAFIDQKRKLLYISEVVGSNVIVYNLSSQSIMKKYSPSGIGMLDDFTLSKDGKLLIGADYWKGNIVTLNTTDFKSASLLISGVRNPTSARWGCSDMNSECYGFNSSSLFVSEGNGLLKREKDRRVLQYYNVEPFYSNN